MRVLAAALLACLLAEGTALAREHHTDGRAYLKRANALAGEGKCAAAIKDYTKAYEKLHDPVVLFNRAECYRRTGENAKAVEDYRGFLKGFPAAPNRADIEAKIAALEKPATPPPAARPPAAKPSPPPPATATAPPSPTSTPPATKALPPPAHTPPAVAVAPPPEGKTPPSGDVSLLPPSPGPGSAPGELIEAPRTPPEEKPKAEAQGSRWWLWTSLAVVVVAGGVAGYLYFRPKDEPLPPSTLGNYRF